MVDRHNEFEYHFAQRFNISRGIKRNNLIVTIIGDWNNSRSVYYSVHGHDKHGAGHGSTRLTISREQVY